ncbi:MAG: methyltransferase domain-containing protein, partial [Treponema sp.]|nr:methyltransferase domain-containing protein [Treponema sp.]
MSSQNTQTVLLVPACEEGRGGGHLTRCLFLLRALEESRMKTYIFIPEEHKDNVFLRFRKFFESARGGINTNSGFYARLLSRKTEIAGEEWDFIVIDRFRTPDDEFSFWANLAPVIGIDEGGPCRSQFDFLIDLLPALDAPEANISAPGLLPLPRKRRRPDAPPANPPRVLISFGAEDMAGLGFLAARSILQNTQAQGRMGKDESPEITFIAPNWDYAGKKQRQLTGVNIVGMLPNLKEQMAEYDLFITHFGIGAFEAVYARLPVLLVSPTDYHEKLSQNAGFLSLGLGVKAAARLQSLKLSANFLKVLAGRGKRIAGRFALEGDQKEDMGSFLGSIAPRAPRTCPICGEKIETALPQKRSPLHVIVRFDEESYRRCNHCRMIYLSRLKPPPITYDEDYFFDFYKKQYGKTYLEDFPNLKATGLRRLANILRITGVSDQDSGELKPRLLDIGCAYGAFLEAAAECGFSPSGIDPIEDAVRYAKEELGFPAWQGFFPSGAKAEDGPWDAVTLWYVIEHFHEPGKILQDIHRSLRDGGALAFSTPSFTGASGR